jgi:two-component system, response regulator YesN
MPDFESDALHRLSDFDDWRLERLARYLQSNLHHPLSLARAAQLCGLETTYFSRYFRTRTGTNFSDWYREARIEKAKILLGKPRAKVDQISESAGYRNITTFERAFRRSTGMCPLEYRRSLRRPQQSPQESPIASQETTIETQETLSIS